MAPDLPIETHGFRLRQLEQWRDTIGRRVHDTENHCAAYNLHTTEQLEVNRDIEKRMREVERSALKSWFVLGLIGAIAGIIGTALAEFAIKHI